MGMMGKCQANGTEKQDPEAPEGYEAVPGASQTSRETKDVAARSALLPRRGSILPLPVSIVGHTIAPDNAFGALCAGHLAMGRSDLPADWGQGGGFGVAGRP